MTLVGSKLLGLMERRYSNDSMVFVWDVHETNWVNEMGEDSDSDAGFDPLDFPEVLEAILQPRVDVVSPTFV